MCDKFLKKFQKCFFQGCVVHPPELWGRMLAEECACESNEDCQKNVIMNTMRHPLNRNFSLSSTYQKWFLKILIDQLEHIKEAIAEDVILEYLNTHTPLVEHLEVCHVVSSQSHKTYWLKSDTPVSVQESTNIIQHGTTGLKTWTAASSLAQWLINNPVIIENKNVLELGSGTGLLGCIAAMLDRPPATFTCTDHHLEVLALLHHNSHMNHLCRRETCWECAKHGGDVPTVRGEVDRRSSGSACCVDVVELCWGRRLPHLPHPPDVVLASDVVFDVSVMEDLTSTLLLLLSSGAECCYVASTVRNPQTITSFHEYLRKKGIRMEEIQCEPTESDSIFCFSTHELVEILKLSVLGDAESSVMSVGGK